MHTTNKLTNEKESNTKTIPTLGRAHYFGQNFDIKKIDKLRTLEEFAIGGKMQNTNENASETGMQKTGPQNLQKSNFEDAKDSNLAEQPTGSKNLAVLPVRIDLGSMPIIDESCEFLLKSMKGVTANQDPELRAVTPDQATSIAMLAKQVVDLVRVKAETAATFIDLRTQEREVNPINTEA